MKKTVIVVAALVVVALLSLRLHGQDESAPGNDANAPAGATIIVTAPIKPQTQLETISQRKRAMLVKGYTDIGEIQSEEGLTLRITAVEITDQGKQDRQAGLAIQLVSRGGNRSVTCLVDEDEIQPLLDAIDGLSKVDHSVTRLGEFEASYRTKADLEFANVRTGSGRVITVSATQILSPSGQVLSATASFRINRLADIHQQLAAAQTALQRDGQESK